MDVDLFNCPNCGTLLTPRDIGSDDHAVCPACGNGYRVIHHPGEDRYELVSPEPETDPGEIDTDRI